MCNGKLLDGLIQSLGFYLHRMHACGGSWSHYIRAKVNPLSERQLRAASRDDALFLGETFTSRTEEGLSLSWCKLLPKTITSPENISRRSGLAAPGSLRMTLTVQSVTTIIPKHEASFGKYFQSFIWHSRKIIGFIQSKQLFLSIYICDEQGVPKRLFRTRLPIGISIKNDHETCSRQVQLSNI